MNIGQRKRHATLERMAEYGNRNLRIRREDSKNVYYRCDEMQFMMDTYANFWTDIEGFPKMKIPLNVMKSYLRRESE